MDKKSLTEEDIKLRFITPAIVEKAGWQKELIKMEYYFTDGRVIFQGNVHARKQGKKADYLLHYSANNPISLSLQLCRICISSGDLIISNKTLTITLQVSVSPIFDT